MAQFNNGFPIGYQPQIYYPQSQQIQAQAQQNNMSQNNNGIIWVQGEASAKSYLVAPNTTVALWDSEAEVIYLKSADASGMPTMRILDYSIRDNTPKNVPILADNNFATKEDINMLQDEINEFKGQLEALNNNKRTVKKEVVKVE